MSGGVGGMRRGFASADTNVLTGDVSSVAVLEAAVDPERCRDAGASAAHARGDGSSAAQRDPARTGAGPETTLAPTTTNGSAPGARRVTTIGKAWVGGEGFALVIDEDAEETRAWHLRAAIWAAAAVLEANGRWLSLARRYVMTHEPGDCLYVPPAWLLDFDETDRAAARSWQLKRGRLVNPDTCQVFDHLWLEVGEVVVSVSNLRNGYPAYAIRRDAYYARNRVQGEPVGVSTRRLRAAARRLGIGPDLARWLVKVEGAT